MSVYTIPPGSTRALRDLQRGRPDLHDLVLAGTLTLHAAMVEAGLVVRHHPVPHHPERAAQTLKRHFSAAELAAIVAALETE